jgi:RimJ/RimL family protein N-acetyltransferase
MPDTTRASTNEPPRVAIRPWAEGDLDLLRALLGDPEMTRYLGGPESEEKLRSRHERYLRLDEAGAMFVITVASTDGAGPPQAAGSVGYWEHDDHGRTTWETGWSVLPDWQGRGIAAAGTRLALDHAAADGRHRFVHAYPGVENGASNRLCEKLGFELVGSEDFEYPKGHWMRCNDWRIALWRDERDAGDSVAVPPAQRTGGFDRSRSSNATGSA